MRKPFAFLAAALLLAPLVAAIFASPASATDLYRIPLNRQIPIAADMDVNLEQVTISDTTYGGSYAPDMSAVWFAELIYEYDNHGPAPETGHLHVTFIDDQGQSHEVRDEGTFYQVPPNGTSGYRFLEINFPKGRKLVQLNVILGFDTVTIPLNYPGTSTPTPTSGATPAGSPAGGICAGAVLLPLALVGSVWIGRWLTRK